MSSLTNGRMPQKLAEDRANANDLFCDRKHTNRANECARRGSADDEASRGKDGYDLPPAALSAGSLEEAGLFILRSGEPEIGEGDGDLN